MPTIWSMFPVSSRSAWIPAYWIGVEDPRVGVLLHLADRGDQLRIPDGHADPPARHVVGLREGVELDAHLLRPVGGQEAQPLLAVEDDLAVGVVVADGDVVRLGEGDEPVEERPRRAGAGRVVRVVQEHPPRLLRRSPPGSPRRREDSRFPGGSGRCRGSRPPSGCSPGRRDSRGRSSGRRRRG